MKKSSENISLKSPIAFFILLFLTFTIAYYNLYHSAFISWDDADVLLKNKDVHRFNLKAFFTKHYVGNYAPITMISFAIDWILFKDSAFWHHLINILFHFINACLVYKLIKLLSNNTAIAIITCIIFSLHPTQIETVAWVAAKNNLLYAMFFLAALIAYLQYLKEDKNGYYVLAFVLFAFSALSKPSAICFPLCLPVLHYVVKSNLSIKSILKTIPFFVISIIIGIITIYTRSEDKFINDSHAFPFYERIGYAGYAIYNYVYRFLFPVQLSVIYPYPQQKLLSLILGYIGLIGLIFIIYKLIKTKRYQIIFGLSFFIINLLLVLQFIPFGEVLTADRYMYLPIIGLSLIILSIITFSEKRYKQIAILLLISLGLTSFLRSNVWKNSTTLYTDIIKKYPHSFVALNSLGAEYMNNRNDDLALKYFNAAISENLDYYKGYYNRGLLFAKTNHWNEALSDFSMAIKLKQYPKAYVARANVYYMIKDFPKAIEDAELVLKQDTKNTKAYFVLANCYDDLNDLEKALAYYNKAINSDTDDPLYYLRRAVLLGKKQQFDLCLKDLETCTTINPLYPEAYYWKAVAKVNLNQNPCADFKKAVQLGFSSAQNALIKYCN